MTTPTLERLINLGALPCPMCQTLEHVHIDRPFDITVGCSNCVDGDCDGDGYYQCAGMRTGVGETIKAAVQAWNNEVQIYLDDPEGYYSKHGRGRE